MADLIFNFEVLWSLAFYLLSTLQNAFKLKNDFIYWKRFQTDAVKISYFYSLLLCHFLSTVTFFFYYFLSPFLCTFSRGRFFSISFNYHLQSRRKKKNQNDKDYFFFLTSFILYDFSLSLFIYFFKFFFYSILKLSLLTVLIERLWTTPFHLASISNWMKNLTKIQRSIPLHLNLYSFETGEPPDQMQFGKIFGTYFFPFVISSLLFFLTFSIQSLNYHYQLCSSTELVRGNSC